jgi:hypothetical protein
VRRSLQLGIFLLLILVSWLAVRSHGQYCLPIFAGAGADTWAGIDPYIRRDGRPDFFKYAPIWGALFIPIQALVSLVPEVAGQWFWAFANFSAFALGSTLQVRRVTGGESMEFGHRVLLGLLLAPLALTNAFYGQVNSVLWLLIALALDGSSEQASPLRAWMGGFCLSLAIWMKLFPLVFAVFLVFPVDRLPLRNRRSGLAGLGAGIFLGVLIPLLFWRGELPLIFSSWIGTLVRDLHSPHLKLGLASLLPEPHRGWLLPLQVVFFGLVLGGIVVADRKRRATRTIFEALLMVGVLLLSHMTEPPTLALLAPAAIWIAVRGQRWESLGLVVLLVLLPSDLVPRAWKQPWGGQYAIKTFALLWVVAVLSIRCLRATFRDSRAGRGMSST